MSTTVLAHAKPGAHADVRITVTPTGVRLDLLMNLMFVDGLVRHARRQPIDVAPDEEATLRAAVLQYYGAVQSDVGTTPRVDAAQPRYLLDRGNSVRIDGMTVAPIELEFLIIHPEAETRPGFEQNPLLLMPQVHLSLEYRSKSTFQQVEMLWGTFPLDFLAQTRDVPPPTQIEAILISSSGVEQIVFTQQEPAYIWHNLARRPATTPPPAARIVEPRTLPVGSLAVALGWSLCTVVSVARRRMVSRSLLMLAAPAVVAAWALSPVWRVPIGRSAVALEPKEAAAVFAALHSNIYRAFDYTTEREVYDALAQSVDGALLDALYSQIYTSLIMFEEGGAVSRVQSVTPIEATVLNADEESSLASSTFRVHSRWRVEGVVYHWGHSHTRLNEYVAVYDVAAVEAGWRIVGVTPMEQFRIDTAGDQPPPATTESWRPNR